jgi:AcrR family transcriptional regulator
MAARRVRRLSIAVRIALGRAHFEHADFLDAARTLAIEHGPAAVTVGSVTQHLGAPIGSFYHRFASRDVLLAELWLTTVLAFQEGFVAAIEAGDGLAAALHTLWEYVEKRGDAIWQHRRQTSGYISGTLRYEVLKKAKFRCELCGTPADERALEVDHITPRNKGGADEISNLQALCYSCNAMKRDRDDTDFRAVRASYDRRESECPFCVLGDRKIELQNGLALVLYDAFPVTDGHALVMPECLSGPLVQPASDGIEQGLAESPFSSMQGTRAAVSPGSCP